MTYKLTVHGLVQGVGFRPFVKRLADSMGLKGQVHNSGGVVGIKFNGDQDTLEAFTNRLYLSMPGKADIQSLTTEIVADCEFEGFEIVESDEEIYDNFSYIPPDIATCPKCQEELKNPENRRYNHPFISCVDCGPRYSIINRLPYDRVNTVMKAWELCPECGREYTDIENHRCFAQTIACPNCGPKLNISIEEAITAIKQGEIVAVKDIGGFHFACDALNCEAVERLRILKLREAKPFAVMFRDTEAAREYAKVSTAEAELLESQARPIVILDKIKDLAASVCNGLNTIGAMLPCNPVQLLLAEECGPLVMTSGNISGEPIITDNSVMEQLAAAKGLVLLAHDRDILVPLDDSIVRVVGGKTQMIRRARGYVPAPIEVPDLDIKDTVAYGGDLKAAYALGRGSKVIMGQHFGDMEDLGVREAFAHSLKRMCDLYNVKSLRAIADMHPNYFSHRMAGDAMTVQHHVAHIMSVAAEHGITEDFCGIAFDGTGYGTDGCIWGGEIFAVINGKITREYHLENVKVVGGDAAAKDAKLLLKSYKLHCGIAEYNQDYEILRRASASNVNTFTTSSMGRLFDAVSALLGVWDYNRYEGECAVKLEMAAGTAKDAYELHMDVADGKILWSEMFCRMKKALEEGVSPESLALGFHYAVAEAVLTAIANCGLKKVALSGGVFLNKIITERVLELGAKAGYEIYINEQVPTGDGGIALGQIWYVERGMELCV